MRQGRHGRQGAKAPKPTRKGQSVFDKIGSRRSRIGRAVAKLVKALDEDGPSFAEQAREFMIRFHDYSPLNRMLIYLQRPDATFVKGRRQWEKEGRRVRRGARAIFIVAPALNPRERGPTMFFTPARVYDVSDTEGPPFKVPTSAQAHGDRERILRLLGDLEEWVQCSGIKLVIGSPAVNTLIDGATDGKVIWLRPDLDPSARLVTLAHEIAHVRMHFHRDDRGNQLLVDQQGQPLSRDLHELEAELTSFLLLAWCGIDSMQGTKSYLASWRATPQAVQEHAERCFLTACAILRECQRKRYRNLTSTGPETNTRAARAAIAG
ncbi:MAG: ImmA/IrrE family metallo-endopeptidase [Candidatus Binatia bacterium]|nr:ImmA/IrrE family metallo-endopeptidase [Candidatus Binatia bacterium]